MARLVAAAAADPTGLAARYLALSKAKAAAADAANAEPGATKLLLVQLDEAKACAADAAAAADGAAVALVRGWGTPRFGCPGRSAGAATAAAAAAPAVGPASEKPLLLLALLRH